MAHQLTHRTTAEFPAEKVYAAMVDPDYLKARLERLGGPGAALLSHHVDGNGARYELRHGVDANVVPPMVRSLVSGDLVIERTETLAPAGPGRYTGTVDVRIPGTPASAEGAIRLADIEGGSELVVDAAVTVRVPLIGGKIESMVAEQIEGLLASETAFTLEWLRQRA
ncbi:DUF2505 domain-containing protein [Pseudonocardia sp. N23]|uniref:DUF2505 domain-containing protein n=1 Tax=Pseudonocardia sp. N23 TaxID=1987376 RepID=UPI000BFB72F0|nr:DUF2505 domain-containing protein [Pseudonocardia sp. N23]GAY12846.1 hypothetical protein TOK_1396 [Pseudonocardia sp. N23]